MAATEKELTNLMQQHQAIKAHMGFLTKALKKLTTRSQGEKEKSVQLKEQIKLYRWSLYDFREAIRRHIELDEHIFRTLCSDVSLEELSKEHEEIRKQLDDVIREAENAVYNKLSRQELNQSAHIIREAVKKLCQGCKEHIAEEDNLLKTERRSS
jgi:hemerythrin-like domain-containing protein